MKPTCLCLIFALLSPFCLCAQSAPSTQPLSPILKEAIIEALVSEDGEYAARAKYAAVVAKFGQVQPYAYIRTAENYHIMALEGYLKKNGITPPTDRYLGKVITPTTLAEAALEGIHIEERTVASYERLLRNATGDTELTRIVQNLQRMSRESHLAAFKAASESGGSLTADQIRARVWQKRP